MASLNPSQNTIVTLYMNVDVDNDETLAFSSVARREAYFTQHTNVDLTHIKCSPIKKDTGTVKIKANLADVINCNYMSFINPDFGNKKYYCRIVVDPDFSTKKTVIINYMIDWWMTDMFETEFDECYIERSGLDELSYQRGEDNPYDPRILQFRTAENLPISREIEKPYYEIDSSGNKDGIFIGQAVQDAFGFTEPDNPGCLLVFSDLNLYNLDGGVASSDNPSRTLWGILTSLIYEGTTRRNNLCFYKLASSTYTYLSNRYDQQHTTDALEKGGAWPNNFTPLQSNTIEAPVNYVYLDDMTTGVPGSPNPKTAMSQLLNFFVDTDTTDCILGLYAVPAGLMFFSGSSDDYSNPLEAKLPTADEQVVVNKKLDLYPFSYYRIVSPCNDVCEVRMEDFKNVQDGDKEPSPGYNKLLCHIGIVMDCVEKPTLLVAPMNYQIDGITPKNPDVNMNPLQGLVFEGFGSLPYAYDGFRAHLAAQANAIIGNNTTQYQYDFAERTGGGNKMFVGGIKAQIADALGGIAKDIAGATSSGPISEAGRQGFGMLFDVATMQAQAESAHYNKMVNEANMSDDAYKVLAGNQDNAIYENAKYTRPAFACNEYHAMTMPSLNFNINSFLDIIILRVQINPTILAQYDKYLTMYGMASGLCEVPTIKNFVDGISYDQGNLGILPHWYTLNGRSVHYIKTTNCKIVKKNLVSSAYIKQMFDNGVRFINGDTLIIDE